MNTISQALHCLEQGDVIIYPSESCYSFGCDAKNKQAVEKMHAIKQEPKNKAVILNVFDVAQAQAFGVLNEVAVKLCKQFMPGPLTLIVDKQDGYDYLSQEGIAFRILGNDVANKLAKEFGSAITTTSANIHGEPPLYTITEVKQQFGDKVSCIVDAGDLNEKITQSTIFDTRNKKIVREGAIHSQEIYDFLAK